MSLRVYLAGPSAELDRVRAAAAEIEAAGHVIAEPWWLRIEADRQGRPTDVGSDRVTLAAAWTRNAIGIVSADRVIALCRAGGGLSDGTREEVAYAMALADAMHDVEQTVVVVGDPSPSLCGSAARIVETVAEALRP